MARAAVCAVIQRENSPPRVELLAVRSVEDLNWVMVDEEGRLSSAI